MEPQLIVNGISVPRNAECDVKKDKIANEESLKRECDMIESSQKNKISMAETTEKNIVSNIRLKRESIIEVRPAEEKMSKKALKRQKRWEHRQAVKKQRKEHAKLAKRAKALLEGRDLEREKSEIEERRRNGEGHRRREKILMDRIHASADKSFQVCIDCSFEENMTFKEISSLSSQIRYCYSSNKRASRPVYLSVTSLSGKTRSLLEKVDGFPDGWVGRGFNIHTKSMEDIHEKKNLVYLTSDSTNVLKSLDNNKIYVIGGIVDRNRLKHATINRATQLGIETAKLPISEHLKLFSTKVLTCNHVFDILMKYRECDDDWKEAMIKVLPARKKAES